MRRTRLSVGLIELELPYIILSQAPHTASARLLLATAVGGTSESFLARIRVFGRGAITASSTSVSYKGWQVLS